MEPHYQPTTNQTTNYSSSVSAYAWPYGQANGESHQQPSYYYPQPEHYPQPVTGVPVQGPNATYSYHQKDPQTALHAPSYSDSQSTLPPGVTPSTASAATWYQTQTEQAEQAQQQQQQEQATAQYYAHYPYYTHQQPSHSYADHNPPYTQPHAEYYPSAPTSYYPSAYDKSSNSPSSKYAAPYETLPQQRAYATGYAVADPDVATAAPAAAYHQNYPTHKTEQQPEQQPKQPAKVTTGTCAKTNTSTASARHTSSAPEESPKPAETPDSASKPETHTAAAKPNPKPRVVPSSNKPAYVSIAAKKKTKKATVDDAFDRVHRSTSPAGRRKSPSKSPPPSKPKSDSPRSEWPESLKAYVSRAFSSCEEHNRDAVERELHSIVNSAITNGTMWKTDWVLKKLPNACTKPKLKRKSRDPPSKQQSLEEQTSLIHIDDNANGEQVKRDKRLKRFQEEFSRACTPTKTEPIVSVYNDVIDWDHHTIIGTCSNLEKQYLRLTSAPDSTTVRPLHILKKTLELLLTKWEAERNYTYICDQFKSMRQDLTVQRIKNDFTVKVYETHAQIAIQKGDLGEYNQCQAQLKILYEYDLPGAVMEFTAYRLLYLLHTRNQSEINATMRELRKEQKEHPYVQHALAVRSALANGDYHSFFKLYRQAPLLGGHLIDCFLDRQRVAAMMIICKGYKVTIEVTFVAAELSFTEPAECYKFLDQYNTTYQDPTTRRFIDCKASLQAWTDAMKSFEKVDIKGQL